MDDQKNKNILLVDDETVLRDLLTVILKKEGYTVTSVENGKEALFKIKKNPDFYDLIVMDMVMPEMSGINSFDAIRSISPQMKVLFMSGYFQEQYLKDFEDSRTTGFIKKPFRNAAFLEKVQEILRD